MAQAIPLDFDRIHEVALKGIRRAAVFMGLGVNAARDIGYRAYELTDLTQIQIVPSGANDQQVKQFKQEFEIWIIANGLRGSSCQ